MEWLLDGSAQFDENSVLESAEVVFIESEPGIQIRWTQTATDQGLRRFGLMMSMPELRTSRHGVKGLLSDFGDWTFDLALAIREPHGTNAPEHVGTWFRQFP